MKSVFPIDDRMVGRHAIDCTATPTTTHDDLGVDFTVEARALVSGENGHLCAFPFHVGHHQIGLRYLNRIADQVFTNVCFGRILRSDNGAFANLLVRATPSLLAAIRIGPYSFIGVLGCGTRHCFRTFGEDDLIS